MLRKMETYQINKYVAVFIYEYQQHNDFPEVSRAMKLYQADNTIHFYSTRQ